MLPFLIAPFLLLAAFPAFPQTAGGGKHTLINIQLLEVPAKDVIRLLSKFGGVQVVVDPEVDTEKVISLYLRQQPVEKALEIVAQQIGARVRRQGDIFVIEPAEKAPPSPAPQVRPPQPPQPATIPPPPSALPGMKPVPREERGASEKERRREITETVEVKHVNAGLLAAMLGGTTSSGKTLLDYMSLMPTVPVFLPQGGTQLNRPLGITPEGGTVPQLIPSPSNVQSLLGLPRGARVTGMRYQFMPPGAAAPGVRPGAAAPGVGAGAALGMLLPEGISSIVAYEPLNILLVRGTPEAIQEFKRILSMLDVPPKQVLIEAQFVDVSTSYEESMGIDWTLSTGEVTAGVVGLATGGVLNIRYDAGRFGATLAAALRTGKARVVNAPRVATLNNMPAIISIGTVYPVVISYTYVLPGGVSRTVETVMFFPVTSYLMVWPTIHADDSITIMVYPMLADIIGTVKGPGGVELPQFTYRTLSTIIRVKDGESIVIGGLIRKNDMRSEIHVPWVARLPIIGALFRGKVGREQDTEILIFITPHIIRTQAPTVRPSARVGGGGE